MTDDNTDRFPEENLAGEETDDGWEQPPVDPPTVDFAEKGPKTEEEPNG